MGKIHEPLEDLKTADLPAKTLPFWKITGPGAILVGLSISAGEIVIWPRLVAEYGASMVWAATVRIFIQLWINFEVARWTISTGVEQSTLLIAVCGADLGRSSFF